MNEEARAFFLDAVGDSFGGRAERMGNEPNRNDASVVRDVADVVDPAYADARDDSDRDVEAPRRRYIVVAIVRPDEPLFAGV